MDQTQGQTSKNSKRASSSIGRTMDVKKIRVDQPSTSTGGDTNSTSKACNVYDMSSLEESVNNLETPGGGLKQNMHGPEFQLGLLMLVLWRAYVHEYHQFRLATELEEAEKFDDIVFQSRGPRTNGHTDQWTLRLIQAKHKEGKTIHKIDRADLVGEDGGDFELQKYFHSFIKIQRRCRQKSFYCPFSNAEIKDVLLVTNTDLKTEELKNSFEVDEKDIDIQNDELLGVDSTPNTVTYKISQTESNPLMRDLKQVLKHSSDFDQLVLTIAQSIMKGEQLSKKEALIKEFIHPLRRDVFDCEKKSGKGELKFSQGFFDTSNSSPELCKFRDALFEEIAFMNTCWKFKVRNTSGGISTFLSDELLQKLAKLLAQTIKDNSELQIKDCLGAHQILLEQVINRETSKFYSKFIDNKGNKMLKLRDFLKKETGMAYSKLGSVQIKISSALSDFSNSADKDVLNRIADTFALQLQVQGGNIPSREELLPAELIAYENVLAKKVLDVGKGELLESFKFGHIDNDPKFDIKEFRRILMKKIVCPDKKKEAESFLKKTKIQVSEELANDMQFDENPTIINPEEFARQFRKILADQDSLLPQSNSHVKIEETTLELPSDAAKIFNQNIYVLGKSNMFVEKFKKVRLSTSFFESTKLLGNLGEFREQLIALFDKDEFKMFFKFVFDIRIKAFHCEREECAFQTLPQPFDKSEFKEFLKKFRLIVNYPNRHKLMKAIQCEMQTKLFNLNSRVLKALLHEQLGNWMCERFGTFYTHEEAQKLFKEIDREALNWSMHGVSKAYLSSTPTISYKSCANELEHFLRMGQHKILNIIVKEGLILGRTRVVNSFLKLEQCKAECFRRYVHKFGYLFFESNKLPDSGFRDDVVKCLYDPELWNLIVIECDNIREVTAELLDLLTHAPQACKIVIISSSMFPESKDLIRIGISTEMSQLTEESQTTILLKEVRFQEKSVKLGQLIDERFQNLVDASILAKLIDGQAVKIGTELQFSYGYNPSFYIRRRLVEKLADNNRLKATEDELIEMCSPDSLDAEKCVFIANEEGMGKTTFLSSLSDKLKQKYPQYWVIRIDLNFYTPYFKIEQDNRKSRKKEATLCLDDDGSSAFEYMFGLLQSCERSELNTNFEKNLFQSCMRESMGLKCILLFDSFDEICPSYADIVRDLLLGLQRTQVHRMYISSRLWAINDWLSDFEEAPIQKLRRLTYPEQISFLITFWEERLVSRMVSEGELFFLPVHWLDKLGHFAEGVIHKYSCTTYNSFTGVPLHLQLLAEYFEEYDTDSKEEYHEEPKWQGCIEFLRSENDDPILPEVLDVFDLFKGFIRKKFKIFQVEKMRLIESNVFVRQETEDWFESFANVHRLLALFVIVPPERELAILSIMGEQDNVSTEIQRCIELVRVLRIRHGIIDQVVDGKPHFIQRTFAEYFFVDCIGSVLLKSPTEQHQALYRALLESIFEEFDFYFIWNLFERWLERNAHSIPQATKREFGRYIVSQWNQNKSSKFLAAPIENNLVNTVKLICDSIKEFDSDSVSNIVNKEEVLRCTIAPGPNDLQHGPDLRDELYKYGCINAREMEMIVMNMFPDSEDDSNSDEGDDSDDDDGDLKPFGNKLPKVRIDFKKIKNANSGEPNSIQVVESDDA